MIIQNVFTVMDYFTSITHNCDEFNKQNKFNKLMSETNVSYQETSEKTPKRAYSSVLTNANNITEKYIIFHMQTTVKKR